MATRHDLTIDQGATFELAIEPLDAFGDRLDLNGVTARAQIRRSYPEPYPMAEFDCVVTDGVIDLTLTAENSSKLIAPTGVWDVELVTPLGEVVRLVEGGVEIRPEVTR
ncbi:hypothetical protein [Desulfovibrio inopinatus]|uniref:hypothetical protein n=1 Tax=Desulfovibrio inopinatus TaxID=102109 RepID=UPI00041A3FAE|nr:hypothetical protein [Desulfovibrio inopinatus]